MLCVVGEVINLPAKKATQVVWSCAIFTGAGQAYANVIKEKTGSEPQKKTTPASLDPLKKYKYTKRL